MPTREHLGHLGLSVRGGGIRPDAAMPRIPDSSSNLRAMRASSKGTSTRCRDSTNMKRTLLRNTHPITNMPTVAQPDQPARKE